MGREPEDHKSMAHAPEGEEGAEPVPEPNPAEDSQQLEQLAHHLELLRSAQEASRFLVGFSRDALGALFGGGAAKA
jgi:hypothetical protein